MPPSDSRRVNSQNGFAMTIVLGVILVLLIVGSLYYFATQKISPNQIISTTPSPAASSQPQTAVIASPVSLTPTNSDPKLTQLKTDILSAVDQKLATFSGNPTSNSPKESFIYFGVNGSTQALDWFDLAGTDIMFNPANYPGAKGFYFQADLQSDAPDRRAYARIYNVTNGLGVPGSDINFAGLNPTFEQSAAISLPAGNIQLRVQIHSELNLTTIYNPRIRIVY